MGELLAKKINVGLDIALIVGGEGMSFDDIFDAFMKGLKEAGR